jgi:N-acetylmuramoyl-L-alanine amidase
MKIFAKRKVAMVRELNSTDSRAIGEITDKVFAEFVRYTEKINGYRWIEVKFNNRTAYVREDVCILESVKGTKLEFLVVHCTATPEGRDVTKSDIIKWHTYPVSKGGRGWSVPGYSELINLAGEIVTIHPYNDDEVNEPWEITNGASGINSRSRHIVYAGGCDKNMKPKDTRTEAQKLTMMRYVLDFIKKHPNIKVAGHYHFANKACPSFKVEDFLAAAGVPKINIYKK